MVICGQLATPPIFDTHLILMGNRKNQKATIPVTSDSLYFPLWPKNNAN